MQRRSRVELRLTQKRCTLMCVDRSLALLILYVAHDLHAHVWCEGEWGEELQYKMYTVNVRVVCTIIVAGVH